MANYKSEKFRLLTYSDGQTPYIQDGCWWIGEHNTGVKAEGVDGVSFSGVIEYYAATLATDLENGLPKPPSFNEGNLDKNVWFTSVDQTGFGTKNESGVDYKYLWNVEGVRSTDASGITHVDYIKENGKVLVELYMIYSGGRIPEKYINYYVTSATNQAPEPYPYLYNDNNYIRNPEDSMWVEGSQFSGSKDENIFLFEISFVEYAELDENGCNKFAKIAGPVIISHNGSNGGNLQVRYQSAEKESDLTEDGWQPTIPDTQSGILFMQQKLSTQGDNAWSAPVQISAVDGEPGKDGSNIEFVYYRTENEKPTLNPPQSPEDVKETPSQGTTNLGDSWYSSPLGITPRWKYEYMSVRNKPMGEENWSPYSAPVIWSKWGEKGFDGDGVEYKYYLKNVEETPIYSDSDSNWKDEPQGVSENNCFEYVATITTKVNKETGVETKSTKVALWSSYGKTGPGIRKINTYIRNFPYEATPGEPYAWTTPKEGSETAFVDLGHEETWTTGEGYDNSHIKVGDTAYLIGTVKDRFAADGKLQDITLYGTVTAVTDSGITMTTSNVVWGGVRGETAKDFNITASSYALMADHRGSIKDDSKVTLTAHAINLDPTNIQWRFNGGDWGNRGQTSIEVNEAGEYEAQLDNWSDSVTIGIIKDGKDAISIVLSNPNMTFHNETTGESEICRVIVYEGGTKLTATATSGARFKIERWTEPSTSVNYEIFEDYVEVKDPLFDDGLEIKVTVYPSIDDEAYTEQTMAINWKVVSNGLPGNSITVSKIEYAKGSSPTEPPSDGWQDELPTPSGTEPYIWSKTTYSDGNEMTICSKNFVTTEELWDGLGDEDGIYKGDDGNIKIRATAIASGALQVGGIPGDPDSDGVKFYAGIDDNVVKVGGWSIQEKGIASSDGEFNSKGQMTKQAGLIFSEDGFGKTYKSILDNKYYPINLGIGSPVLNEKRYTDYGAVQGETYCTWKDELLGGYDVQEVHGGTIIGNTNLAETTWEDVEVKDPYGQSKWYSRTGWSLKQKTKSKYENGDVTQLFKINYIILFFEHGSWTHWIELFPNQEVEFEVDNDILRLKLNIEQSNNDFVFTITGDVFYDGITTESLHMYFGARIPLSIYSISCDCFLAQPIPFRTMILSDGTINCQGVAIGPGSLIGIKGSNTCFQIEKNDLGYPELICGSKTSLQDFRGITENVYNNNSALFDPLGLTLKSSQNNSTRYADYGSGGAWIRQTYTTQAVSVHHTTNIYGGGIRFSYHSTSNSTETMASISFNGSKVNCSGQWNFENLTYNSSREVKHNIESLLNNYSILFDNLKPVRYIYNNDLSNTYHTGFILEELYEAITEAGLTTADCAAYYNPGNSVDGGINYIDIIALNTWQIQLLKPRMTAAEQEIKELKNKISTLEEELENLKNS